MRHRLTPRLLAASLAVALLAACGGDGRDALFEHTPTSEADPAVVKSVAEIAHELNTASLAAAGSSTSRSREVVEMVLPVIGARAVVVALTSSGEPAVMWRGGVRTTAALPERVVYLQITNQGASVCLRLSDNGTEAGTNSNDPTVNGPYNEYVSPQDGVLGRGWAIVGYAKGGAQDEPTEGRQNGCDGVPTLFFTGEGWTAGAASLEW